MQDIDPAAVLVGVDTHIADRPSEGRLGSLATVVSPCQAAAIPIIDVASGSQVVPSQSSDPSMSARSGQLGEGLQVKVPPPMVVPKRAFFLERPVVKFVNILLLNKTLHVNNSLPFQETFLILENVH